jgi:hypothetical protein
LIHFRIWLRIHSWSPDPLLEMYWEADPETDLEKDPETDPEMDP